MQPGGGGPRAGHARLRLPRGSWRPSLCAQHPTPQGHRRSSPGNLRAAGGRGPRPTWALGAELVGHVEQGQQHHQAVVPVGLDEVVPRDGCGVDVVLPERPDERLAAVGPDQSARGRLPPDPGTGTPGPPPPMGTHADPAAARAQGARRPSALWDSASRCARRLWGPLRDRRAPAARIGSPPLGGDVAPPHELPWSCRPGPPQPRPSGHRARNPSWANAAVTGAQETRSLSEWAGGYGQAAGSHPGTPWGEAGRDGESKNGPWLAAVLRLTGPSLASPGWE